MRSPEARIKQLQQLHLMFASHEDEFYQALQKDLRKCKSDTNVAELLPVKLELLNAMQNLSTWMAPVKADNQPIDTCELRPEPLGVVLIIPTWNYPIQLLFMPLVGALAAGNCVVVKPSEVAPNCSSLFTKLMTRYLSPDIVKVVEGEIPETTALLRERFDLIFYVGSTNVGKIIMKAAAQHLTPVLLELGGKSPAIVDGSSERMETIVQRIAWGKFGNAGQTCIAPDYVLFVGDSIDTFVELLKKQIVEFYGENPQESNSYGRIVSARHFKRICGLIDDTKVVHGNVKDENDLYISPTIVTNISPDDPVMQEEIFGPVLPILKVATTEDAIAFVNNREKPLALYPFSSDSTFTEKICDSTSSGSVCVNDVIMQATVQNFPFGGVGNSGMGRFHGKSSFESFSNMKSYMRRNHVLEGTNGMRYPPITTDRLILKDFEFVGMPGAK